MGDIMDKSPATVNNRADLIRDSITNCLTLIARASIMCIMNKLGTQPRVQIIKCLVDGVGVNATCRLTGAAKHTVLKLLREIGPACGKYHDEHVRNIKASKIQVDEIWSFCYAKEKNVPVEKRGQFG